MSEALIQKQFRAWIERQPVKDFKRSEIERQGYAFTSRYGRCEIRFYDDEIVEMMIRTKTDSSIRYYLHFQLKHMEYAKTLYREMMEAFHDLKCHERVRVLLCCTSGATTGYFANLLNEASQAMGLEYSFEATSYYFLYDKAPAYDVILAAPQINYKFKNIVNSLPRKLILQMPTVIFAQNNAFEMLKILNEQMDEYRSRNASEEQEAASQNPDKSSMQNLIITVGATCGSEHFRSYGRVYDGDKIISEDEQVKPKKFGANFMDIIDNLLSRIHQQWDHQSPEPSVAMISLGLPGELNNGYWTLPGTDYFCENLKGMLEDHYGVPVELNNNANASALGYSMVHPEYHSVLFYSHPYRTENGGMGIVIGDSVLKGRSGRAGEAHYFNQEMKSSGTPKELCRTEVGCYELVTKELLPALSLLDPDVVAVRSPMTSDMEELKARMGSFIPHTTLPEFVYIPDMENYMLEGCREMGMRALDQLH
ncbi:MAG: ROK family protein [Erysipelotrichaceae bacterium]|nr:ROK family protein [Erysipelotrichaceae bacterium]